LFARPINHNKQLLAIALLALFPATASAQWVWSAETGWVNSQYVGSSDAKRLIAQAKQLEKSQKHGDASSAFKKIARDFPQSQHAREALFRAAENKFKAGEHYEANKLYEQYLERFQKDRHHSTIAQRRYQIGRALVRGEKRKWLGFKILNDKAKGEEILQSIINDYPFEKHAEQPPDDVTDDAMFVLANYYYREKRYDESEALYQKLRDKFARSEWAPASLYKIALCQQAQSAGARYDTSSLRRARRTLKQYRKQSPEGTQIEQSAVALTRINDTLANGVLDTAMFYHRRGKLRAARIYFKRLIRKHPKSKAADKARTHLSQLK